MHMTAHSLGANLTVEARHHLPAGAVSRIISMTGASWRAGRTARPPHLPLHRLRAELPDRPARYCSRLFPLPVFGTALAVFAKSLMITPQRGRDHNHEPTN